ncbi:MAG: Rha family transcriptional regulator [Selenomonadaceae bacterium]|nr:Rha family transcriptional regulator [Selenomonadaceae bacterium]
MLNLVHIRNGQAVTSSRTVAEIFGKYHKDVLEQIRGLLSSAENSAQLNSWFFESSYKDSSGKSNREYFMTRDGFVLLAMGFTGKKALDFKIAYLNLPRLKSRDSCFIDQDSS